jgi:hypothetical protein
MSTGSYSSLAKCLLLANFWEPGITVYNSERKSKRHHSKYRLYQGSMPYGI